MSWSTWDVNDYGISDEDIKTEWPENKIRNLLEKTPELKEKVEKLKNLEDYDDDNGGYGEFALLTKIISKIEQVTLEYHAGENGNFILFPPFYPWNACLANDKSMTTDKLDGIYMKYFGTAGDFVSAQYQG